MNNDRDTSVDIRMACMYMKNNNINMKKRAAAAAVLSQDKWWFKIAKPTIQPEAAIGNALQGAACLVGY